MTLRLTHPEDAYLHLHPDVRHLAAAERAIRTAAIYEERWIDYPVGVDAIERLFELIYMPRRQRMPSILFWADPNAGKTSIHKEFQKRLERVDAAPEGQRWVVELEINTELDEHRLYFDLLVILQGRAPERATIPRLQRMLIQQLRALGVRMLVIDELQRLSKLGTYEQAVIMDALRYISSQLRISIAGFGSNEAKGLIEGDLHLKERFEVVALPSWTRKDGWPLDVVSKRLAYMPLRKPTEVDRKLMEMLERHSGRNLGRLLSLLERSAVAAVDGEECLSADLVEAVAARRRRAEVAWYASAHDRLLRCGAGV